MSQKSHFRRCHVCGETNAVNEGRVEKCVGCGKHLAPYFYFDESKVSTESDGREAIDSGTTETGYAPIRGLSTYW